METKICSKCGKDLPLSEYYVIKANGTTRKKDYVYSYCKKDHYKMTKPTAKKWRAKYPKRWSEDVHKAQKAMFSRDRKGVYLLITSKGLYVGQTDKYEHRVKQHRNNNYKGNMKYKGATVFYATLLVEENNAKKRRELEKKWIKRLRPALNKEYNPDWKKPGLGKPYVKK